MPRPKKDGAVEPKRRSRHGCWPCKSRKIKCGEEKPRCLNCERAKEICDYSIRLNWDGRSRKADDSAASSPSLSVVTEGTHTFLSAHHRSNSSTSTPPDSSSPAISSSHLARREYDVTSAASTPYSLLSTHSQPTQRSPPFLHPQAHHLASPRRPDQYSTSVSAGSSPHLSTRGQSWPKLDGDLSPFLASPSVLPLMPMQPQFQQPQSQGQRLDAPVTSPYANSASSYALEEKPRAKRRRLSPPHDSNGSSSSSSAANASSSHSPYYHMESRPTYTSTPVTHGLPLTPSSEDGITRPPIKQSPSIQDATLDSRRLSVKSLLSETPEDEIFQPTQIPVVYGYDQGRADIDLPRNDDKNALVILSPSLSFSDLSLPDGKYGPSNSEFGFGLTAKSPGFEKGGYYGQPVVVSIPANLMPLPSVLSDNPMNLLYFHHFLNHTARILVLHDCPDNPFRNVLPQLAISNPNLLHLLLAYSASHRARLLNHPEPSNRIATWVRDVFPSLRKALCSTDSSEQISDANLATAIMLASLEIISPNVFEVSISWQEHLRIARSMIIARGGLKSLRQRNDSVSYFLSRWFAYLDVVGSLSGTNYDLNPDQDQSRHYWLYDDAELASSPAPDDSNFEIDCLLGFTSHCVTILAKVAELAKRCDRQRINASDGTINSAWRPSGEVVEAADKLKADLRNARSRPPRACVHAAAQVSGPGSSRTSVSSPPALSATHSRHNSTQSNTLTGTSAARELVATNDAFHWAGSIHLSRRVLGKPRTDPEVQLGVSEICRALDSVVIGGTAEVCMIFPMFTAGCEAVEPRLRDKILARMEAVESVGMAQVSRARKLMQEVWATGKPWEALVAGEFFG